MKSLFAISVVGPMSLFTCLDDISGLTVMINSSVVIEDTRGFAFFNHFRFSFYF